MPSHLTGDKHDVTKGIKAINAAIMDIAPAIDKRSPKNA